ncbi:MAG: GH36-type glycosyl hydrolase domain-containing protein, partial [Halanaerobiales bacterium]
MKYGNFNVKKREYVICDPQTPTPWINYLGNGDFGGIISQTGGGYCFDRDPRHKRILRYRYNSIPIDQPGRYIYIRDDDRGNYWSANWQPVKEKYQKFRCQHGLGYTGIEQVVNKISSSLLYFIPLDEKMEIWWLKLKNFDQAKRKLSLFTYAEFSFFDAVADQQNLDWTQQIQQGSYTDNTIYWNEFSRQTADTFFTSNVSPVSFTTSRENFVGKYRDLGNPQMVELGRCDNYEADRGNGAGVLHHQLTLQPGEEKRIGYYLGTIQDRNHLQEIIQNYTQRAEIEKEFHKLKKYWDHYLEYCQVKTPDQDMNLMLNTWHPYQCRTTFNWSRFVSLYQLGIKRGMGFRDSAQDILGVVHALPDECRQLIIKLLG